MRGRFWKAGALPVQHLLFRLSAEENWILAQLTAISCKLPQHPAAESWPLVNLIALLWLVLLISFLFYFSFIWFSTEYGLFFLSCQKQKNSWGKKKSERNSCLAFCENMASKHEELTVPVLLILVLGITSQSSCSHLCLPCLYLCLLGLKGTRKLVREEHLNLSSFCNNVQSSCLAVGSIFCFSAEFSSFSHLPACLLCADWHVLILSMLLTCF